MRPPVRKAWFTDAAACDMNTPIGLVGPSFQVGNDDLRESPMVALVEASIDKGGDGRILDRNVEVARLVRANRCYTEGEIPPIASLMFGEMGQLLALARLM